MQRHKAQNDQLVLLFILLFLKLRSVGVEKIVWIQSKLRKYLAERSRKAQGEDPWLKEQLLKKIEVNKKVIEKYYGPEHIKIDADRIR